MKGTIKNLRLFSFDCAFWFNKDLIKWFRLLPVLENTLLILVNFNYIYLQFSLHLESGYAAVEFWKHCRVVQNLAMFVWSNIAEVLQKYICVVFFLLFRTHSTSYVASVIYRQDKLFCWWAKLDFFNFLPVVLFWSLTKPENHRFLESKALLLAPEHLTMVYTIAVYPVCLLMQMC